MSKQFALISSTNASVVRALYSHVGRDEFNISLVLTDRECGAQKFAHENGIRHSQIHGSNANQSSDFILNLLLSHAIDYVYVFYDRLLAGNLLRQYSGRLINFHPSLLPACPGMHGFEESMSSGALIIGSTVHFIDDGIDTGEKLIQTMLPVNPSKNDLSYLRHCIFAQQCASLYQIHNWIMTERLINRPHCRPHIENADYTLKTGFTPAFSSESMNLYRKLLG